VKNFFISAFCLLTVATGYAAPSDSYPSYDQVLNWVDRFSQENRGVVTKEFVGFSEESRPIWVIRISSEPSSSKPLIFFNAAHHGDEVISTETAMSLAEFLARNAAKAQIQKVLGSFDILIQPVVNPDGYEARTRSNASGVDINRDYPIPGQTDRKFFQARETRILNHIFQERDVFASVSIHSGTEAVLWPLCYTKEKPAESEIFEWLAKRAAKAMDITKSVQSYYDYPSLGEQIDHAYLSFGTLALTFEIADKMAPELADLPAYNERVVRGAMQFLSDIQTIGGSH
jgi:murein tripeptide amidase MpaA